MNSNLFFKRNAFSKASRLIFALLALSLVGSFTLSSGIVAAADNETSFTAMLNRAEALVNYEWVPSERIYTWNGNEYQGKEYFEAGETVRGVPYTLFSWELGFDSLLSLTQYKTKAAGNYSTARYCNSVSADRIGPAYGNCCATFVSEVFGGNFMNGSNPRYDGVGTLQKSTYATTYTNVKADEIQAGDALSCTSGAHIVWIGDVTADSIVVYESTPPACKKTVINKASNINSNGYLVYNGNVYNIVTKSNELIRDDLYYIASASAQISAPIHAYTKADEKTVVYDSINGAVKTNKIYGTDQCFIDAVFENGWCHVNFPLDSGGLDHGYVKTTVFFEDKNIRHACANASMILYNRSNLQTTYGRVGNGSDIYLSEETADAIQIACHDANGGYKLGWVSKKDFDNTAESVFLDQFCPIKGYPCVTENFEVKKDDYSTRNGEIYTTDFCTINAIYSDGWCQVTFPLDTGGERTAYTQISNFIFDTDYHVYSYLTKECIAVYTKKDLSTCNNWRTGAGDTIYVLGEYNGALQICYPVDAAYGGGYKLGWIHDSAISKGVAGEKTAEIAFESKKITKGTEFTVDVTITDNPGIYYLAVTPVYSTGITLVRVENGNLFADFSQGNQFIWHGKDSDVTSDGLLARLVFRADQSIESGDPQIGFKVRTCGNYDEEPVTCNVTAATLEVADYLYGDSNADGLINGFDVIRLMKYLTDYDYENNDSTVSISGGADVNGDGCVDGFDVIKLKKYLLEYDYESNNSSVILGPFNG